MLRGNQASASNFPLLLRRDGKTVASVQAEGTRDHLEALADRLATAIQEKLKSD
jgi:hypothetical protein